MHNLDAGICNSRLLGLTFWQLRTNPSRHDGKKSLVKCITQPLQQTQFVSVHQCRDGKGNWASCCLKNPEIKRFAKASCLPSSV